MWYLEDLDDLLVWSLNLLYGVCLTLHLVKSTYACGVCL